VVGVSAKEGFVLTGQFELANVLVSLVEGRREAVSVFPHAHRLLLKGVNRKVSRRSLTNVTSQLLMFVFMAEFRKVWYKFPTRLVDHLSSPCPVKLVALKNIRSMVVALRVSKCPKGWLNARAF
jgi:hypothetical protein